ncbi:hypothetical protein BDZ45DRAFT_288592 [Acephala macrosclerotiorum]|nr:hypothetical protein BDZ45DRAFT_288592 [Acephala macrosclerotiorum]
MFSRSASEVAENRGWRPLHIKSFDILPQIHSPRCLFGWRRVEPVEQIRLYILLYLGLRAFRDTIDSNEYTHNASFEAFREWTSMMIQWVSLGFVALLRNRAEPESCRLIDKHKSRPPTSSFSLHTRHLFRKNHPLFSETLL